MARRQLRRRYRLRVSGFAPRTRSRTVEPMVKFRSDTFDALLDDHRAHPGGEEPHRSGLATITVVQGHQVSEPGNTLLSVEEAANLMAVPPASIYHRVRTGELASTKHGRRILIERDEVKRLHAVRQETRPDPGDESE